MGDCFARTGAAVPHRPLPPLPMTGGQAIAAAPTARLLDEPRLHIVPVDDGNPTASTRAG